MLLLFLISLLSASVFSSQFEYPGCYFPNPGQGYLDCTLINNYQLYDCPLAFRSSEQSISGFYYCCDINIPGNCDPCSDICSVGPQDPPQGPPEIIDLPPPGTEQGLRLNEKKPKKKDAVLTTLEDSFKEDLDLSEQPFDP